MLSDDHARVIVRLSIPAEPPVEEWSLTFGEALHAFRSALDAFAFEAANLGGAPLNENRIYFPIAKRSSNWKDATKYLGTIPAAMLERVNAVQPYRVSGPNDNPGLLHLLHDLDIRDKHKGMIESRVGLREVGVNIQFDLDGTVPTKLTPVLKLGDEPAIDGRELTLYTIDPPLDGDLKRIPPQRLKFVLAIPHLGFTAEATQVCKNLIEQMPELMAYLMDGTIPSSAS